MSDKSFKSMTNAGELKRADSHRARLDDIHEEPGFNLRHEGEDLEASVDQLADYMAGGGIFPALEVQPRDAGGVTITEGHRRRRALAKVVARGMVVDGNRCRQPRDGETPENWVSIVQFTGDEAERIARVMTSAEGRGLSPLETAMGYLRLASEPHSLDSHAIAAKAQKTYQHVEQLLTLARAPQVVRDMVQRGEVSAAEAVKIARQHGDQAGEVLQQELDKAKGQGKGKVTGSTIKGKPLPPKLARDLEDSTAELIKALPLDAVELMAKVDEDPRAYTDKLVKVPAAFLHDLMVANQRAKDERAKQKKKAREKANKAAQQPLKSEAA